MTMLSQERGTFGISWSNRAPEKSVIRESDNVAEPRVAPVAFSKSPIVIVPLEKVGLKVNRTLTFFEASAAPEIGLRILESTLPSYS